MSSSLSRGVVLLEGREFAATVCNGDEQRLRSAQPAQRHETARSDICGGGIPITCSGQGISAAPASALDSSEECLDLGVKCCGLFQIDGVTGVGADPEPRAWERRL